MEKQHKKHQHLNGHSNCNNHEHNHHDRDDQHSECICEAHTHHRKQECSCEHDHHDHDHGECGCGHHHNTDAHVHDGNCSCGHDHNDNQEHHNHDKQKHTESTCDTHSHDKQECSCEHDHHNHNHEECGCGHHHNTDAHVHDENCSCGHNHQHDEELATSNTGTIPENFNSEAESFFISGVDCPECAKGIQKAVTNLRGVIYATFNFSTSVLKVLHNAEQEQIINTVKKLGYDIMPITTRQASVAVKPWWQEKKVIITALATLCWVVGIITPWLGLSSNVQLFFLGMAMALGIIYPARTGFVALRNRMPMDMNVLLVIAVAGAVYLGEYFEAATVCVLFSIGKMLEFYSMDKTRQSIRSLMDLTPATALVRRHETEIEVPIEEITVGETVIIKPGMKIGLDGKVLSGFSHVNQASITGESLPVIKESDDEVYAGTLNEDGYLEIVVTHSTGDTTLDHIIDLVEEAQAQRAPSQRFVDVFAKYYTPAVIMLAFGIALLPPLVIGHGFREWFYRGIALLVVSCPCALVISTPVSIVSAIGNAAKNGILIKGGAYLELAGSINAVAFDKTGTLTVGQPQIVAIEAYNDYSELKVLQLAATVESSSDHPLAKAIVEYAKEKQIDLLAKDSFLSLTGRGVQAIIEGNLCVVCKPEYAEQDLGITNAQIAESIDNYQTKGQTVMLVVYKSDIIGIIVVADVLRPYSITAIKSLRKVGIKNIIMLTGDNDKTATAIANELAIDDYYANLMPDQKVTAVRELIESYQKVAMVGDGVNDAPALATATVGIAMGGAGTDTALETADIVLMADDLNKLSYAMQLSRQTLKIIKQNIWFSIIVKLAAIILVFPGWLTLWIAVMADTGAALVVILNGMRLLKYKANLNN